MNTEHKRTNLMSQSVNQTNKSEIAPTKITPRRIRQRKIAQGVVQGKTYREIGEELAPDAKYPSQTVSNRVNDPGVQREINAILEESDIFKVVTVERVLKEIKQLAFDTGLKPREREGYLKMLAEYLAMLKQVNLNESVTSSDELTQKAEQAIEQLKRDTLSDSLHNGVLFDNDTDRQNVTVSETETRPTPSGNEVEATPGARVSERLIPVVDSHKEGGQ